MDAGLRTPLIEAFRRGDVPLEVRLDAAAGQLGPRLQEHLALLLWLSDDEDTAVRTAAVETLAGIPVERVAAALALPDTPAEMVRLFAERGITPAPGPVDDPAPAGEDQWDSVAEDGASSEGDGAAPDQSITQQLQQMSVVQRVRAAMKGSREVRALLVRDPNRMVASAVLSSPKLTTSEVEAFAKMANVSEDVLRTIGQNRAWVKSYTVAHALARNPKTPVAMSLNLLQRITDRDVKALSVDRNVPEPLRVAARKRVANARQG